MWLGRKYQKDTERIAHIENVLKNNEMNELKRRDEIVAEYASV